MINSLADYLRFQWHDEMLIAYIPDVDKINWKNIYIRILNEMLVEMGKS